MSSSTSYPVVQQPKGVEILNVEDFLKDPTMITVIFQSEDHTMANLLKHVIAPIPGVEFVGASETHPLEDRICIRIQTDPKYGLNAKDVLNQGFETVKQLFDTIENKVESAYNEFSSA